MQRKKPAGSFKLFSEHSEEIEAAVKARIKLLETIQQKMAELNKKDFKQFLSDTKKTGIPKEILKNKKLLQDYFAKRTC